MGRIPWVNSVLDLPNRQVIRGSLGNSNYRRTVISQNPDHQKIFSGLVKMTFELVHAELQLATACPNGKCETNFLCTLPLSDPDQTLARHFSLYVILFKNCASRSDFVTSAYLTHKNLQRRIPWDAKIDRSI